MRPSIDTVPLVLSHEALLPPVAATPSTALVPVASRAVTTRTPRVDHKAAAHAIADLHANHRAAHARLVQPRTPVETMAILGFRVYGAGFSVLTATAATIAAIEGLMLSPTALVCGITGSGMLFVGEKISGRRKVQAQRICRPDDASFIADMGKAAANAKGLKLAWLVVNSQAFLRANGLSRTPPKKSRARVLETANVDSVRELAAQRSRCSDADIALASSIFAIWNGVTWGRYDRAESLIYSIEALPKKGRDFLAPLIRETIRKTFAGDAHRIQRFDDALAGRKTSYGEVPDISVFYRGSVLADDTDELGAAGRALIADLEGQQRNAVTPYSEVVLTAAADAEKLAAFFDAQGLGVLIASADDGYRVSVFDQSLFAPEPVRQYVELKRAESMFTRAIGAVNEALQQSFKADPQGHLRALRR